MYCIISDTALYSELKQRPLAALLIHFSPPFSFFFECPTLSKVPSSKLQPIWTHSEALCVASLLWHMQCVHAALVIVEPKVCLM